MADDPQLGLSDDLDEIVIVEVKRNSACTLNGPWTDPVQMNVQRVLAAIGCFQPEAIRAAAEQLYRVGEALGPDKRIRLIAVGRDPDPGIAERHPRVLQLTWENILSFIWERFRRYEHQKAHVPQWDAIAKELRKIAIENEQAAFVQDVARRLGVNLNDGNRPQNA